MQAQSSQSNKRMRISGWAKVEGYQSLEMRLQKEKERTRKLEFEMQEMGFDVKSSEEAYGKIKKLLEST